VRTLSAEVLTRRESRRTGRAIWLDLAGSASRRHRARDVKPMFSPPPGRWRRGAFRPPASSNRHWVFWKPGGGPTIHCDAVCKLKNLCAEGFQPVPRSVPRAFAGATEYPALPQFYCLSNGPSPAVFDRDVIALDIAGVLEALPKCAQKVLDRAWRSGFEEPDHRLRHRLLLRARRKRPCSHPPQGA
jgi:hypothetical protein